jgi:hypothetical protein
MPKSINPLDKPVIGANYMMQQAIYNSNADQGKTSTPGENQGNWDLTVEDSNNTDRNEISTAYQRDRPRKGMLFSSLAEGEDVIKN